MEMGMEMALAAIWLDFEVLVHTSTMLPLTRPFDRERQSAKIPSPSPSLFLIIMRRRTPAHPRHQRQIPYNTCLGGLLFEDIMKVCFNFDNRFFFLTHHDNRNHKDDWNAKRVSTFHTSYNHIHS